MVECERAHRDRVKGRPGKVINCWDKMENHLTAIHYHFSELELKLSTFHPFLVTFIILTELVTVFLNCFSSCSSLG